MNRLVVYWKYFVTAVKRLVVSVFNIGKVEFHINSVIPYKTIIEVNRGGKIQIGSHTSLRSGCKIVARENAKVCIGDRVSINYNCIITAYKEIEVGEGTIIGPNVCIYDQDHAFENESNIHDNKYNMDSIVIGQNVWIGANSIILRGTTIGDGCVIGAGSIVKGKIAKNQLLVQKKETTLRSIG